MKKLLFFVTFLLAAATTLLGQMHNEFPLRRTLNAPLPVIEPHPYDGHMRDYLIKEDDGDFRLAAMAKWRVEFHLDEADQSTWIISIIDTSIASTPLYLMSEPSVTEVDSSGFAEPLDPKKNFCVTCETVLRVLSLDPDATEQLAGMRFMTNVVNAELQLEDSVYIWPDGKKADMTIQVFERSL